MPGRAFLFSFFSAMAFTILGTLPAAAADLRQVSDAYEAICNYRLTGPIMSGDAAKLERIETNFTVGATLCFDSPGGSLTEGQAMFDLIRERQIRTRVEPGAKCHSACAIAWLGGSVVLGTNPLPLEARVAEAGSSLGFHAPGLNLPSSGTYSDAQVERAFRIALKAAEGYFDIKAISDIGYEPMNDFLYQRILATPPEEMFVIDTIGRAVLSDIPLAGVAVPTRITGDMVIYICELTYARHALGAVPKLRNVAAYLDWVRDGPWWGPVKGERARRLSNGGWAVQLYNRRDIQTCFLENPDEQRNRLARYRDGGRDRRIHDGGTEDFWVSFARLQDYRGEEFWQSVERVVASGGWAEQSYAMPYYAFYAPNAKIADVTATATPGPARYTQRRDTDILGNDLTQLGRRDVSLNECQTICTRMNGCRAVSYITQRRWCWPKSAKGPLVRKSGVTSALQE